MTPAEYQAYYGKKKNADQTANRLKFKNIHTEVDGIRFDSKKEAEYYGQLKIRKKSGDIEGFVRQMTFKIEVNGVHICDYRCDFVVYPPGKPAEVIDVKSPTTAKMPEFRIKKALMKAVHNIDIKIV